MSERLNKATICSVVFLDIPDQSSKPVVKQIKDKELLNSNMDDAIRDAVNDRILVDTNDGRAIARFGAPEEDPAVAMTTDHAVLRHKNLSRRQRVRRAGLNAG